MMHGQRNIKFGKKFEFNMVVVIKNKQCNTA